MLKKIALMLVAIHKLQSMEVDKIVEPVCYLTLLPNDILRSIAFLTYEYETDNEFIERTKVSTEVLFTYFKHVLSPHKLGSYKKTDSALVRFLPDKHKIALYETYSSSALRTPPRKALLTIFNKKEIIAIHEEYNDRIEHIAISRSGNLYAYIHRTLNMQLKLFDHHLVVHNLITKKTQQNTLHREYIIELSHCGRQYDSIAFNLQGDCIIVCGKISSSHPIFPINPDVQEQRMVKPKTLNEYFYENRVCKQLPSLTKKMLYEK